MTAVRARKRAPRQGFAILLLQLDQSWETNPQSTTLLWTCQNGESLPPPWPKQTSARCAIGKPTDHTGKQELDRCRSGTGLESPVLDFSLTTKKKKQRRRRAPNQATTKNPSDRKDNAARDLDTSPLLSLNFTCISGCSSAFLKKA